MLLLIDIGNTNITVGVSDAEAVLDKIAIPIVENNLIQKFSENIKCFLRDIKIDGCAITSVVEGLDVKIKKFVMICTKLIR